MNTNTEIPSVKLPHNQDETFGSENASQTQEQIIQQPLSVTSKNELNAHQVEQVNLEQRARPKLTIPGENETEIIQISTTNLETAKEIQAELSNFQILSDETISNMFSGAYDFLTDNGMKQISCCLSAYSAGEGTIKGYITGNEAMRQKQASSTSPQSHQTPDGAKLIAARSMKKYQNTFQQFCKGIETIKQGIEATKTQSKATILRQNIFQKLWEAIVHFFDKKKYSEIQEKKVQKFINTLSETSRNRFSTENDNAYRKINTFIRDLSDELPKTVIQGKEIEKFINKLSATAHRLFAKDSNNVYSKISAFIDTINNNQPQIINQDDARKIILNLEKEINLGYFLDDLDKNVEQLVSDLISFCNDRESNIACLEIAIGGNNATQGTRTFNPLKSGPATALKSLLIDYDDAGKITPTLLHNFAQKYGKEALDSAVKGGMLSLNGDTIYNDLIQPYQEYYTTFRPREECPKLSILNDNLNGMVAELKQVESDQEKINELEQKFEEYKAQHATNDGHTWALNVGEITIMVNPDQTDQVTLASLGIFFFSQK